MLLNCKEDMRSSHISEGRTIIEYLSVRYDKSDVSENMKIEVARKDKFNRTDHLQELHEIVSIAIQPLDNACLIGKPARTAGNYRARFHFLIAAYAADLPEEKYMLASKHGNNIESTCHRCFVGKGFMPIST